MSDTPQRPSSVGDVVRGVIVSRILGVVGRAPAEQQARGGRAGKRAAAASGHGDRTAGASAGATRPGRPRLGVVALGFFVIGVILMIPFEATATRILGVTALFAFIATGLFAIARPDFLGADE